MVNSKAMGKTAGPTGVEITDNTLAIKFRKERLAHLDAEISKALDQKYILQCELRDLEKSGLKEKK